jgi:hypothetical protein
VHVTLMRDPAQRTSADALLTALEGLGGTRAGQRMDDVTFSPALAGSPCTAFAALAVPAGTRQSFRLRATGGMTDRDRLRLVCSPG